MPLVVEIVEESIDHTVTAFRVLEVPHDLQAASYFPKRAFNNIGGPDHLAEFLREVKDRNQLVEIFLQAVDGIGDCCLPSFFPCPELFGRHGGGFGVHDSGGLANTIRAIPFGAVFGHIAQFIL